MCCANYTVRKPGARPQRHDAFGIIVSRHKTFASAVKSFRKLQRSGCAEAYIWSEEEAIRMDPELEPGAAGLWAKLNALTQK